MVERHIGREWQLIGPQLVRPRCYGALNIAIPGCYGALDTAMPGIQALDVVEPRKWVFQGALKVWVRFPRLWVVRIRKVKGVSDL